MGEYLSADVYLEEQTSEARTITGVGTTTASFIGIAERGPVGVPILITSLAQYRRVFGGYMNNGWLTYAVADFFKHVKGRCFVVRTAHYTDITDPSTLTAAKSESAMIQDRAGTPVDTLLIRAFGEGTWGDNISCQIVDSVAAPGNKFTILVAFNGTVVEAFEDLSLDPNSSDYAPANVNSGKSLYVELEDQFSATVAPDNLPALGTYALSGGNDGLVGFSTNDVVGSGMAKTGLYAFDPVDEIFQIAAPGYYAQDVHNGLITYCSLRMDVHAILDSPLGMNPQEVQAYVQTTAAFNSKWAFFYYPWIVEKDLITGARKLLPPSGQISGIIARTDVTRGVHKAPAGEEDGQLRDVIGLEWDIDKGTRDILYPVRINPIIKRTGKGFLVWGNRTLSAESDWRDINVRRLFTYIEESLVENTGWAVFEPNDQVLRRRLSNSIRVFLLSEWREGRFYDGGTGDWQKAFYVKCDEENNPQSVIDQHKVIVEIGISPSKAAEFVIIRITQWDGGRLIEEFTSGQAAA